MKESGITRLFIFDIFWDDREEILVFYRYVCFCDIFFVSFWVRWFFEVFFRNICFRWRYWDCFDFLIRRG